MSPRLPHSPPGAPHPCEVAGVLEGPHPTTGMRQEPVSPCSSSFQRGKTSATVWGGCQGGGKPQVSGRWLWPMAHLAGDYVKVAAHPPVNIPGWVHRHPQNSSCGEQGGLAQGSNRKRGDISQQQQHCGKETKGSAGPKPSAESV